MEVGYQAKDIIKITNIPSATVYRIVDKLRAEAKIDFKDLMEKDYLFKYQQNLDNLNKTIIECNEEIERVNVRYDEIEQQIAEMIEQVEPNKHVSKANFMANLISCRSGRTNEITKLIQQRDRASSEKARLFNSGPVVYRINEFVEHKMQQIPPELVQQPDESKTIIEEETDVIEVDSVEITDEDREVLEEMERDM